MKKVYKISIIALFCIVFLLMLAACNDAVNKVTTSCAIDGESMTLPVKAEKAWAESSCTAFITGQTLENMKAGVENLSNSNAEYSAEVFGDFLFIEKKNKDAVHYFMVAKRAENTYYFACPVNFFGSGGGQFKTLVPFHLLALDDGHLVDGIYSVEAGREYSLNCTADDFAEFYKLSGIYEVTQTPSLITVTAQEVNAGNLSAGTFEILLSYGGGGISVVYNLIS